ncbi:MAG: choice-of-anchor Q domain-containing protein, partial [Planctomycetota bacterium]|nr:choice-of-anchor Q domain-containing protein [Planctomycetota bacterium]
FMNLDPGSEMFSLFSNSNAVDCGEDLLSVDLYGHTRPLGAASDMGAVEFVPGNSSQNSYYSPPSLEIAGGGCGALGVEGLLLAFLLGRGRRLLRKF